MKLRKAYIYLLSFLTLSVMFSACYYLSYQHALRQFNKSAIERAEEFAKLYENPEPTPMVTVEADDNDSSLAAGLQARGIIQPTTRYILEVYDMKTDTLETFEQNPPGELVGLTREELEQYLADYMNDLTLSEYNKGLKSYELVSFSDEEFMLRKNYDSDMVPYRFYVVVKNGYVVVYNSNLKDVFYYTQIEAKNLPEKDRVALSRGIYVNDLEELYALLESYSS